ncbi:MAG: ribonuclease HII [Burkholderiales bacterium]|nr:ribonuclease HII [Burkholderiales bacterium]
MNPAQPHCGVDEAGRGPLAGPVFAAAVILDPGAPIAGLADSKRLSPRVRAALAVEIRGRAAAWAVAASSVREIDELNILHATLLAMRRAVEALPAPPALALIDGPHCPRLALPARAIVGGDATVPAISAASILAKVARDEAMLEVHRQYPRYGFDRHKGYPTREHLAALRRYGPCGAHRSTFAPVRVLAGRTA